MLVLQVVKEKDSLDPADWRQLCLPVNLAAGDVSRWRI